MSPTYMYLHSPINRKLKFIGLGTCFVVSYIRSHVWADISKSTESNLTNVYTEQLINVVYIYHYMGKSLGFPQARDLVTCTYSPGLNVN